MSAAKAIQSITSLMSAAMEARPVTILMSAAMVTQAVNSLLATAVAIIRPFDIFPSTAMATSGRRAD